MVCIGQRLHLQRCVALNAAECSEHRVVASARGLYLLHLLRSLGQIRSYIYECAVPHDITILCNSSLTMVSRPALCISWKRRCNTRTDWLQRRPPSHSGSSRGPIG